MASTYSIVPSLTTLNEGQILETMVHTSGVDHGTVLYWVLGGTWLLHTYDAAAEERGDNMRWLRNI